MSPTLPNPHHPTSEELFAYRDGELVADRRALIEAHVLACVQCRERIDAMSSAEADLRSRPDGVDEEYFDRMTESVLAKVGAGVRVVGREPAREEAGRAPAPREPEQAEPPRIDRRRPDYLEVGAEPKRRLRMPWIGVAGGVAAAVAVVIVAVALFQRQQDWLRAPRPALVGEPRASAPAPESTLAKTQDEEQAPAPGAAKAPKRERAASAKDKLAATKKAARGGAPSAGSGPVPKSEALRGEAIMMSRAPVAPEAAPQAAGLAPPGGAFGDVIRTYRLPPVWNPGVPTDAVTRAEKDLRFLYQTGRAGADSARIRLYLAEAERARLTDPSSVAAVQSISRHYRRAISLAGSDAALAATARQRLNDFEQEMIRRRGTTP
jgi:putative zinc finger protein